MDEGMIRTFLKHGWSNLPAEIAVDARVINEEIARHILCVCVIGICHKESLPRMPPLDWRQRPEDWRQNDLQYLDSGSICLYARAWSCRLGLGTIPLSQQADQN
jgi:hypothetical protein